MNEYPLLNENDGIPLFYPHIPKGAIDEVADTLSGRWIGQGPKVDLFEKIFKSMFLGDHEPLTVGSGTDALHLAYLLAGINAGDDVIVPVFTCTATNIPLLYIGANPIFADIDPETLNISIEDVKKKITKKTKAIVCVDYGGVPNHYKALNALCAERGLKLIVDGAHSLGTKYSDVYSAQLADFTIFSFQAIKTLTTGDGGLLAIKDASLLDQGKKIRWFGIDRSAKQKGIWENDIVDIGYKYQMNDIAAAIGLAGLKEINDVINYRNSLFKEYEDNLKNNRVRIVGKSSGSDYFNSAWLLTIIVDKDRVGLMKKLRENGIESAQVHYRNDRYKIFGERRLDLPNMDALEERYLVLPLHTKIGKEHVARICEVINAGW
jgi:dTDP-4-amino-4,6-dideoxygalactose transaminase